MTRCAKIFWTVYVYTAVFTTLGINYGEYMFGKPPIMQWDPELHYGLIGMIIGTALGTLVSLVAYPEETQLTFNPYPYTPEQWEKIMKGGEQRIVNH